MRGEVFRKLSYAGLFSSFVLEGLLFRFGLLGWCVVLLVWQTVWPRLFCGVIRKYVLVSRRIVFYLFR